MISNTARYQILLFNWKYEQWLFERKGIKTNKSDKQILLYYAHDWHRTKHIHAMDSLWHGNIEKINIRQVFHPHLLTTPGVKGSNKHFN